jgi:hypothetical protein
MISTVIDLATNLQILIDSTQSIVELFQFGYTTIEYIGLLNEYFFKK